MRCARQCISIYSTGLFRDLFDIFRLPYHAALLIVFNRDLAIDLTSSQTTRKQRPGRCYRPSIGQKTSEATSITDRESCRSVTGEKLGRVTAISKSWHINKNPPKLLVNIDFFRLFNIHLPRLLIENMTVVSHMYIFTCKGAEGKRFCKNIPLLTDLKQLRIPFLEFSGPLVSYQIIMIIFAECKLP